MLNWVTTVENAFQNLAAKPKSLSDAYELQKGLLTDLIMMVRKDLTSAERSKVMCMITMDAHSRDIIQKLIEEEVRQQDEF